MATAHAPLATARSATGIPTGRLALWWVLASEVVIFGGLLASYIMLRLQHPDWGDEASHTSTVAGALNTFVLLTSSLFAVLGHKAAVQGDGPRAARFLWMTVGGGAVFMLVKVFEYTSEITHGFTLFRSVFWGFYFTATGLHGLHVLAGMAAIGLVAVAARRGEHLHRVELVGIYWHFVDVVWIFLFPLLYLAK